MDNHVNVTLITIFPSVKLAHKQMNSLCLWSPFHNYHDTGSQFQTGGFSLVHWMWKRHPALMTLSQKQREPINSSQRFLSCRLLWCLRSVCSCRLFAFLASKRKLIYRFGLWNPTQSRGWRARWTSKRVNWAGPAIEAILPLCKG